MNSLSFLIKKINNFYLAATNTSIRRAAQAGYYMPDDSEEEAGTADGPGLYPKVLDAARQISDPDIAAEVLMIAELYKKAIELNNGYNFVNKGVSNLVNLLDDEDDEEQSSVEDLLNEISRDLRTRAKSSGHVVDSDAAIQAILAAKNQINTSMIAEDLAGDEPSAYEAGLSQYQEGAEGTFDPTGGVSGEVAASKGRGYHVQSRSYKDWAQSYENEKQRLMDELQDPELQKSKEGVEGRRIISIRSNLEELINVLDEMSKLTAQANELETQIQAAPDPTATAKLNEIRSQLKEKQARRVALKQSLRNYQLAQQVKNLETEAATARSPIEQRVLQEKIALTKLMMSPDHNKGEEAKWRRALINAMTYNKETQQFGRTVYETAYQALSPEQLASIEQKIQEGAAQKTKATKAYEDKARQVAKLKGTIGDITSRQVGELGKSVARHKYDWGRVQLDGLVEHLTQRLATERVVVKQKVTDKMKKAQQDPNGLKLYMDAVAKAATKKDKAALMTAVARLKQKMTEFKNVQPEVISYIISLRTSKFFYLFRDKIKTIGNWVGTDISPDQVAFIKDTIKDGYKLTEYYKNLKIKPITPGWAERSTHYNPPVEIIEKIVKNLSELINA